MAEDTKKNAPAATVPMVTLTIDGRETTVPKGTTVLEAATAMGIHIPTFCWHPKLKPVGACRMCYVEIEKFPKLQVSCATEVMEGMIVHTDSDQVKQGRRAVLEFILLNHPLDCPTCDKGGECDLQNLTFAHGVDDSRFEFQKYRFVDEGMTTTFDDKRIGPEIILNRNRCILCYKCVRANKQAFGEYDLGVYERGNIGEINAAPGQEVDNPFSGNLVEICPVGALTNTDWRYKIRVWLTKTTPSICPFTSSGSNTLIYKEDHKNHIYRVTSRRNDDVDDGWLADVTRYGYQIANSDERLQTPLIKKDGKQVPATWDEALDSIREHFGSITEKKGRVCIGGLASPHLDNASLWAFSKFFRTILSSNNVDFRSDYPMLPKESDSVFSRFCDQTFRISDIDDSDVIVVFGSDLIREHPNEYLRIRKARNFGSPRVYSINPYAVKAADVADLELVYKAGFDEAVVDALCLAGVEEGLVDQIATASMREAVASATSDEAAAKAGVDTEQLKIVVRALAEGRKVTFIIGELIARCTRREVVASALANLNLLLGISGKGQMAVLAQYPNSKGAVKLGLVPDPSGPVKSELTAICGKLPEIEGHTTDAMLAQMKKEEINGFFALGVDLAMLYPDRQFVRESLEKTDFFVACDLFETETTQLADVVLPLASWAEYAGDYVNLEGRVQRAEAAIKPIGQSRPGYDIVNLVAKKLDQPLFENVTDLQADIDRLLAVANNRGLPDAFVKVKNVAEEASEEYPWPLYVCDDPHHRGHLTEKAPSLVSFCGEAYLEMSPDMAHKFNIDDGDSVRVESPVGKVIVPARISEHLENDVLLLPRNFSSAAVTSLQMRKVCINRVKISKVDE